MQEIVFPQHAIQTEASVEIAATPKHVASIYRDVQNWGETFPATIEYAKVIQTGDNWKQIEVTHKQEGRVPNTLFDLSETEIGLKESKHKFDASFLNRLDASVQSYLPEFNLADPAVASEITIRQLLNQTSGLSETGFPDMTLPQPETIAERMTSLRSAQPVAKPGTEYHYFSPNYGTLARVVEVVSGQPLSAYLESHVFAPLGMQHTLSVVTSQEGKQKAGDLAQGHLVAFGIPFVYPETDGYLGGSGGVISTAEDIAHYMIVQTSSGRYRGQVLVGPRSMELMHTPPQGVNSTYAMGWMVSMVNGRRVIEHNGLLSANSADAILLPDEGIGIALLFNVSSLPSNAIGQSVIREGLIDLPIGQQPEKRWMSVKLWGWLTALMTLAGGFLAVRSLWRLPSWSQKTRGLSVWKLLPGILWAFAPALMLLWGIPAMTAKFAGRLFGFVNLYKSMLGIFTWFA